MKSSQLFYNKFHKSARPQAKIISKNNFTYAVILDLFKETVKNTNNLNILDFGCGVGTLDIYLSSIGNNVIGFDISNTAVNLANENARLNSLSGRAKFYTNDFILNYKNFNKFDLIICTEVLEHLEDPKKALKEVLRISKKYVLLSVPNEPLFLLSNFTQWGKDIGHINHWTFLGFEKFVKKNAGINVKILSRKYPFPWTMLVLEKQ